MTVDRNSTGITGLTEGQPEIGTEIRIRWGDDRKSKVELTSIEVTYQKMSKFKTKNLFFNNK